MMNDLYLNEITGTIEREPAERTRPGIAVQRVNHYDEQGNFLGQYTLYGTERMARAYAILQHMHDTDPGYEIAYQAYCEEAAKVRAARRR